MSLRVGSEVSDAQARPLSLSSCCLPVLKKQNFLLPLQHHEGLCRHASCRDNNGLSPNNTLPFIRAADNNGASSQQQGL